MGKILKLLPISVILIAWFYVYYQGISTAANVWADSEIFNHCFLVIPGALFLIYQKRVQLIQQPIKNNYWLIFPLLGTLVLYTFGLVGDIRLFMHIATFVSLPLIIWLVLGNQAARIIIFPLYFMLFAIPIGDQLIPYLQELTTDLAVPLLEFTGVPIYRNGLYLDIPEGRFLVAEACSGISFLIASIVFGNVYAYLSFRALPKQLFFVFISILVPVLANALRVYGIILTAHLTDMEYAAGADHLIYGGVFYAIILFLLIIIGERFRDKNMSNKLPSQLGEKSSYKLSTIWPATILVLMIFTAQITWIKSIEDNNKVIESPYIVNIQSLFTNAKKIESVTWLPNFKEANEVQQGTLKIKNNTLIDFYIATYTNSSGELISSLNKLYDEKRWTLTNKNIVKVPNLEQQVVLTQLVSPQGEKRIIIHWFQISDKLFSKEVKAKLFQSANKLFGKASSDSLVAFSLQASENLEDKTEELLEYLSRNSEILYKAL
jgi:exosortase A